MGGILIAVVIVMIVCIMVITPQGQTTVGNLKKYYYTMFGNQKIERGIVLYRIVKKNRVFLKMYETPCVLVGRNAVKELSFSGKKIAIHDISGFFGPSVDQNAILVECKEEKGQYIWRVQECNPNNAILIGETKSGEWLDAESYTFASEANFKIGKSLACIQGVKTDEEEQRNPTSTKNKTKKRAINLE